MSDEPFATCVDCDKSFSGPEPFTEHLASKAHDKKVMEKRKKMMGSATSDNDNKLKCEVCNVFLSGEEPMKQHLNGNKHLSMLKKKDILDSIESEEYTPAANQKVLTCKVCEKCFSGPENLKQHMSSKKHIRKIELSSLKKQMNGDVEPSCPPPPIDELPKMNIYPSLTEDYKIVHNTIANDIPNKPKMKTTGCFSAIKTIFKKDKAAKTPKIDATFKTKTA